MEPIARRKVKVTHKETGVETEVSIEVFAPYPVDEGANYFCRMSFTGLEDESQEYGGADSLQALSIAVAQVKKRFEELQAEYDFSWPDGLLMDSIDYLDWKPPGV